MARYAIEETTLTAIADGARNIIGESEIRDVPFEYFEGEFDNFALSDEEISAAHNAQYNWYEFCFKHTHPDIYRCKIIFDENQIGVTESLGIGYIDRDERFIQKHMIVSGTMECEIIFLSAERAYSNIALKIMLFENGLKNVINKFKYKIYLYDNHNNLITTIPKEIKNTMTPMVIAERLNKAMPSPKDEELVITGSCDYRFASNGWNWFIEKYGDKITTKDITNSAYMFDSSSNLKDFSFDINYAAGGGNINDMFGYCSSLQKIPSIDFKQTSTDKEASRLFYNCYNLKEVGILKNMYPASMKNFFTNCYRLRELPAFENINMNRIYTYSYGDVSGMFQSCYSLRSISSEFLKVLYNPVLTSSYYAFFYNGFTGCYTLDEINGIAPISGTMTSNMFYKTFEGCHRVKNITFALQEDGTLYTMNWKNQTIDLTANIGIANSTANILNFNSGITADKQVKDDETYQTLKNDPDWFATDWAYSRYNHDSAVNTINSLPITNGTNTIKFKGAAGSATDGGAINTLTEEEIAVATAKGWTVSLV